MAIFMRRGESRQAYRCIRTEGGSQLRLCHLLSLLARTEELKIHVKMEGNAYRRPSPMYVTAPFTSSLVVKIQPELDVQVQRSLSLTQVAILVPNPPLGKTSLE